MLPPTAIAVAALVWTPGGVHCQRSAELRPGCSSSSNSSVVAHVIVKELLVTAVRRCSSPWLDIDLGMDLRRPWITPDVSSAGVPPCQYVGHCGGIGCCRIVDGRGAGAPPTAWLLHGSAAADGAQRRSHTALDGTGRGCGARDSQVLRSSETTRNRTLATAEITTLACLETGPIPAYSHALERRQVLGVVLACLETGPVRCGESRSPVSSPGSKEPRHETGPAAMGHPSMTALCASGPNNDHVR